VGKVVKTQQICIIYITIELHVSAYIEAIFRFVIAS